MYFFADFGLNRIWTLRKVGAGVAEWVERTAELTPAATGVPISNIAAFGEDAAGELYLCDFYAGNLYKIEPNPCRQDYNGDGLVTVQDIFDFLKAWFGSCLGQAGAPCSGRSADFNGSGTITVQDIFDFLAAWFSACS